jgi:hypothetical protein
MSGLFNRFALFLLSPSHFLVLQTFSRSLFCAFHVPSCFCQAVRILYRYFFIHAEKKGFRVHDSLSTNPIEQIMNRKDDKKSLVIKSHLPFKLLPKEITSEVKKPKVNEYAFLTSK